MRSSPRSDNGATQWIVVHQPRPAARMRLICFPFAGGGASVYRAWASGLPEYLEVAAVQAPGRESRLGETPIHRMEELIGGLLGAALPFIREKPFAFSGHSLGAIVALETSRAMARAAMPQPLHLIVSARPAPHLPLRRAPVAGLSREGLKNWLRSVNGTPEAVLENDELMDLFLPTLRADLEIDDTYRPKADPPLACSLTALGGTGDEEAKPEELQAWSGYTAGSFSVRLLEGGHFFAFDQGRPAALAAVAGVLANVR